MHLSADLAFFLSTTYYTEGVKCFEDLYKYPFTFVIFQGRAPYQHSFRNLKLCDFPGGAGMKGGQGFNLVNLPKETHIFVIFRRAPHTHTHTHPNPHTLSLLALNKYTGMWLFTFSYNHYLLSNYYSITLLHVISNFRIL